MPEKINAELSLREVEYYCINSDPFSYRITNPLNSDRLKIEKMADESNLGGLMRMNKSHYFLYIAVGVLSFLVGLLVKFSRTFWIHRGEILIPLAVWPFLFCLLVWSLRRSQRATIYGFLVSSITSLVVYAISFLSPFLLVILLILLPLLLAVMGYAFKHLKSIFHPAAISYAALILSFLLFFAWSAYSVYNSGYYAVYIEKHKAAYEEWVEISEEDLKKHGLGKLIEQCDIGPCKFEVSWEEWEKIRGFIESKRYKFLFHLKSYGELVDEMNGMNNTIDTQIREIFKERGYSLSGDLRVKSDRKGWWITDRANDKRYYIEKRDEGLDVYIYCDLFKIGEEYYKFQFLRLRGD